MYKFKLGQNVKCKSTGLEGVVDSFTWENGPQYTILRPTENQFFYREEHELDEA